jgi:hypothetical protein
MKIEIIQNDNGVDVVTIDGQPVSGAVAEIVLNAAYDVEVRQGFEASIGWVGEDASGYGPEDDGDCPCGGVSCDGTCGGNDVPF